MRSELLERGPGEEEALLADAGETYGGLGLVAGALHVDDDAFTPLAVAHVVTHLEVEPVRARSARVVNDPR